VRAQRRVQGRVQPDLNPARLRLRPRCTAGSCRPCRDAQSVHLALALAAEPPPPEARRGGAAARARPGLRSACLGPRPVYTVMCTAGVLQPL
jgi:hypothetical protein